MLNAKVMKDVTKEALIQKHRELEEKKDNILYKMKDIMDWEYEGTEFSAGLGNTMYKFTPYAKSQFLKKLRIPSNYFDACSPELRDKELREGFDNLSDRGSELIFKTIETDAGPYVYGIVPKQYPNIRTSEALSFLLDTLPGDNVTLLESASDLERTRLRFSLNNQKFVEVDSQIPMVDFKFSEVGANPLMMQTGLYRLVCSNGMMLPMSVESSFSMPMMRYKMDIYSEQLRHIGSSVASLGDYANVFEKLKEIELPKALIEDSNSAAGENDFDEAFNLVMPSKVLRRDYDQLIRAEYNSEGNLTLNGLCNAITRTARDLEDNTDKERLESAAGSFISKIRNFEVHAYSHEDRELEYSLDSFKNQFHMVRKQTA